MVGTKTLKVVILDENAKKRGEFIEKLKQSNIGEMDFEQIDDLEKLAQAVDNKELDLLFVDHVVGGRPASDVIKQVCGPNQSQGVPTIVFTSEENTNLNELLTDHDFDTLPRENLNTPEIVRTVAAAMKRHNLRKTILDQREQINKLNTIDVLTGLWKKQYLMKRLEETYVRSRRYGYPLTIALANVDHYSHISQTYGALAGDRVLATFAEMARDNLRETDYITRYADSALCLVLVDTEVESGSIAFNRLRRQVASRDVPNDNGDPIYVTASFGVAGLDKGMDDFRELLVRAESCLSTAKTSGRNRIQLCMGEKEWSIADDDHFD